MRRILWVFGTFTFLVLAPALLVIMNRTFRNWQSLIHRRWMRNLQHDALSTQVRRNQKAKEWNPWTSPLTWTLAVIPLFTFGLGTWQVQRLQWKNDLVRQAEEQLAKDAITLPNHIDITNLPPYRRVLARGLWLHPKSILLGPRKYDSYNGYHLITPLARQSPIGEEASTILVNRGFVSDNIAASADKNPERISRSADGDGRAEVDVVGLLSPPFTTSMFTPDNHPEKGEWIWPDMTALVENAGGEAQNVQPVLVESIFEGGPGEARGLIAAGKPVGRYPAVFFRNQHASYAITWYSLSVGTAFLFFKLVTKKPVSSFGKVVR